MADAVATFAATLDSSGLQSGAKSGLSALERLGQQIQRRSKDLAAMQAAQQRLAQSAGVKDYLKRQEAIKKNEQFAAKMEKRLAAAQENLDIAKQANVPAEDMAKLTQEAERAAAKVAEVKAEIKGLTEAQKKLASKDAAVAAYRDQAAVIKSTEAELVDLQSQYSAAGGSATALAKEIKEPKQGLAELAEKAKAVGGPIGALGSLFEQVANASAKAGMLAMVAVILAIAAAAIKATYALAKMILVSADAARNSARTIRSAAFGSTVGAADITATMTALREQTALSKDEAQALASELYRLGDRGARLEQTALTIERFGQLGDDAKQAVKGLYEELRKPTFAVGVEGGVAKSMVITKDMLPRDVFMELATQLGKDGNRALVQGFAADKDQIRAALARIGELRFAGPALEQMQSLDKLSERLRENIASLFEKVKIGVLLGALQKLVAILDETSASGKAIRDVLGAFGQSFANAIEAALPYLTVFVKGLVFGGLIVALVALKIKNALGRLIPDSLTRNIDWLKVAFVAASAIVIGLALAFTVLAAALFGLSIPFIIIAALIALVVYGLITAIDVVAGWFDELSAALEGKDFSTIAKGVIDGLIKGLQDGASALFKTFGDLAKGGFQAFKDAIQMKSPPRLYVKAGEAISNAVAMGVENEAPQAESAISSMANPADMVAPGGGSARGGGSITINVQPGAVVIQGVQGADELEDEGFVRKLGRALISAAREGGLSPEPAR